MRKEHARRGGGGVDEAGDACVAPGRPRTLLRLGLHRTHHACAVRTAWLGQRERPYAIGGRSPKKPTPERCREPRLIGENLWELGRLPGPSN